MPASTPSLWVPVGTNTLLSLLPDEERARVEAGTERISVAAYDVYSRPGEAMSHVYFPLRGVISLVTRLEDGSSVETATIGNEGMVGIQTFLGAGSLGNTQAMGQVPGEALRMKADRFRAEADGRGRLRQVMLAYAQALFAQISQSVACNVSHGINLRCARWLLEAHDRAGEDRFLLTQEFLSQMLRVRRPSVTMAARTLQEAGLIEYERGRITVRDRMGLEEASCECYRAAKNEYGRLLSPV